MNVKPNFLTLTFLVLLSVINIAHATLSTTPDLKFFNKQRNNILEASQRTGVNADLITAIAYTESGLGRNKLNRGSGTKGVMQFTNQTWRSSLKVAHKQLGLPANASVMNDRANILVAANDIAMNKKLLKDATGHTPTDGDLYMAHLMGLGGAIKIMNGKPNASIGRYVKLYGGNRALTHRKGKPLTVAQFRSHLNGVVRKNASPFMVAINQANLDQLVNQVAYQSTTHPTEG